MLPGRILEELTDNDRSIGGITPRCARKALAFYKRFVRGACVTTDARSAEMTKLVENAYRDVNIAFANELSIVADAMGLDVWEVIRLANRHPRVNILSPGPGVGGHCIAVDPWFIVHGAPEQTPLIRTARGVNDAKIHHAIAARRGAGRSASAGARRLPRARLQGQHRRFPREPGAARRRHARAPLRRAHRGRRALCRRAAASSSTGTGAELIDLDAALETCDVLIVLVDHDLFRSVPLAERAGKAVYDTRGIWPDQPDAEAEPEELRKAG